MMDPNHPMNALMRLNQIHPGLQYRLLSQSGPVHAPVFTMSVDIQGNTYQATGNSKRTAKLQVALKVFQHYYYKTAVTVEILVILIRTNQPKVKSSTLMNQHQG